MEWVPLSRSFCLLQGELLHVYGYIISQFAILSHRSFPVCMPPWQWSLPTAVRHQAYSASCFNYSTACYVFVFSQRMSTVVMQSLAYVQYSSSVPGAKLFISGDLRLQQRTPLPHRGLYSIYNVRGHRLTVFLSVQLFPVSHVFSFSLLHQYKFK